MKRDKIEESELLKHCLTGNSESFAVLVGKYQSLVCAITYGSTGDVEVSEELAQEAFLLAWENLPQLKDLAKFKAWLCQIARNVIQNWLRAKQRDLVAKATSFDQVNTPASVKAGPVEAAISAEEQAVMNQVIKTMPEKYRTPLVLFYRENKSTDEVAELIGLSNNATRQRIARGRTMLKGQVAAMVERNLLRTKPGKAFTTGVVVSVAGVSMKGVSTATAVTTGISALAVKIASIAAGVLVVAGISYSIYTNKTSEPRVPQQQATVPAVSPNNVTSDEVLLAKEIKQKDVITDEVVQEDQDLVTKTFTPLSKVSKEKTPYVFKPQGVLSGLITEAQTGEPIPNVLVEITNNGVGEIRTDEFGFYHIDKLFRPGNCRVSVYSRDYVGFSVNSDAPQINLAKDQQSVKHFQLARACKVNVQVVDVNGLGIQGVELIPTSVVHGPGKEINDQGLGRKTDEDGYYLLGGFAPLETDYMITAIATKEISKRKQRPGVFYVRQTYTYCPAMTLVRLTDPNRVTDVKIVLKKGQTIHGYAECRDKEPAAGVKLSLKPRWWHCYSTVVDYPINKDGTFSIPHIEPGIYNVSMSVPNSDGFARTSSVVKQVALPQKDDSPLVLHLPIDSPQSMVSIFGSFVNETKENLLDMFVHVHSRETGTQIKAVALERGEGKNKDFEISGLKPGRYSLSFEGHGFAKVVLKDVEAPSTNLRVKLEPKESLYLEGSVVDDETFLPITEFKIRLRKTKSFPGENSYPSGQWVSHQHREGLFQADLPCPGVFQVQVVADGYAPSWSAPINTDQLQDVSIRLSSGGQMIGRIVNMAGEPINNAKVTPLSWAQDTNPKRKHLFKSEHGATLSQHGKFSLSCLPEGFEAIKVIHPDYVPLTVRDIDILVDQVTQIDDVVLVSGGAIEGNIFDEQGNPLANQGLSVCEGTHKLMNNRANREDKLATVVTDANGYYYVEHLPSRLCFVYRHEGQRIYGVTRRAVTPQEGELFRLDFGAATFNVTGMLQAPNHDLAQRRVILRSGIADHFQCITQMDASGSFFLAGIVPGTYNLVYEEPDSRSHWKDFAIVTVSDADVDLGVIDVEVGDQKNKSLISEIVSSVLKSSETSKRSLALKLPLFQQELGWAFLSQADYFSGKLILRISGKDAPQELIIFEDGYLSDGWRAMPFPNKPDAREIYFGFESLERHVTSQEDRLEIELHVASDLEGLGALQTGILRKGIYKAKGTYTMLTDEYKVPDRLKAMPKETIDKFKETFGFRAVLETWESQWPIEITSEQGWLESPKREQILQLMESMK